MAKPQKAAGGEQRAVLKKTADGKRARRLNPATLCAELEKAAAGLTQPSETDCGYQFFMLMQRNLFQAGDALTPAEFLGAAGIAPELLQNLSVPAEHIIEERDFNTFLPSAEDISISLDQDIKSAPVMRLSNKYRRLEKLLVKRLGTVKVFRVGVVEVRCYLAGFINGGHIAGLVTTVIET